MKTISAFDFSLVNVKQGYVSFKVRYTLDAETWEASGMGWADRKSVHYFLVNLYKNKMHATLHDMKRAGLDLYERSFKFGHEELEKLTALNIKKLYDSNI